MSVYKTNGSAKILIITTGVPVQLSASQLANRVDIQALKGNAGDIIIGDNQIAQDNSKGGIEMPAGSVYNIELIRDLTSIYVNGTAGDGITINWWIGDRN